MVHKGLWIFVFLNEAILSFFTYSRLRLHFKPKFCCNLYWCILMINVEFNDVSKFSLGFKIRQSYFEISRFFWLNSCRITISRKNRKIQKFKGFDSVVNSVFIFYLNFHRSLFANNSTIFKFPPKSGP